MLRAVGRTVGRTVIALGLLTALPLCRPTALFAQCPDGTPPPCNRVQRRVIPAPAERGRRFLLLPFRNITRAAEHQWLVEGSTTMLGDALSRWQEIRVVPDEQLYPALRRRGLTPGSVMDAARVRAVAEETGGWTAVTGEVLATGGRVRVSARAVDVVSNRELVRAAQDVRAGDDVRSAFERIASQLLHSAGLDTAVADIGATTTRSLDAYRAYLSGAAYAHRSEYRRARDTLLVAVQLDSTFAQAWFLLSQATLLSSPYAALFDSESPFTGYVGHATALATRLPPRDRDLILAVGAMFGGRLAECRASLQRLVESDSNDVNALSWLSFFEWIDPMVVTIGGREVRRGSFEHQVRLLKRVLELNPAKHEAYFPLVSSYMQAAGDQPGILPSYHREAPLNVLFRTNPELIFIPMVRDSLTMVLISDVAAMPAESVAGARRRALDSARVWVGRWLAVGPTEGEAHRFAAKLLEFGGQYGAALSELRVADSLGVETGLENVGNRRLILIGKDGRYADAYVEAMSAWRSGRFLNIRPFPNDQLDALAWSFNLFLMNGAWARADSSLGILAGALSRTLSFDSTGAENLAQTLLSGAGLRPIWQTELPTAFRALVMDSVWAHRADIPPVSRVGRNLMTLVTAASRAVQADSALAERARAAPWFHP